jgi:hypothetical protein
MTSRVSASSASAVAGMEVRSKHISTSDYIKFTNLSENIDKNKMICSADGIQSTTDKANMLL